MVQKKKNSGHPKETTKLDRLLEDMDNFIDFARMNIDKASDDQLENLIDKYTRLLIKDHSTTTFQDYLREQKRFFNFDKNNNPNEMRRLFYGIQLHLRTVMNKVADALQKKEAMILESEGTVRLVYNKKTNKFEQVFIPLDFTDDSKVDLATECSLITSRYFETISYLAVELPPGRFKVCQKCGIPFFQKTKREKLYCSAQCAAASAQAEYAKRNKNK